MDEVQHDGRPVSTTPLGKSALIFALAACRPKRHVNLAAAKFDMGRTEGRTLET